MMKDLGTIDDSDIEMDDLGDFPVIATRKSSRHMDDNVVTFTSQNQEDEVDDFDGRDEAKDKQKKKKKVSAGSFQGMGLTREVLGGILKMGYKVPTPIQRKSLPVALSGRDIVAMARTGSGKTAAFLIPLLEKLGAHSATVGARGLVLSPTRELAQQTNKFALQMARLTSLRICLLQGGDKMEAQFEALSHNPDIIVATPGRLVHLLAEVPDFGLNRIEMIVIDEADRLFEMGFAMQLREIMGKLPEQKQTLLFSATMPTQLMEFARAGLDDPELIRLDAEHRVSENLKLAFFTVRPKEKPAALIHLLTDVIPKEDMTIIFTATRHHVEFLKELLLQVGGLKVSVAYGSMDMAARKQNLENFRQGKTKILIVTDVAARGLDIPLLNNVINYEFPCKAKLFVHRVGRAARQNRSGTAYSFITADEMGYVVDLHLFLGHPLKGFDENDVIEPYELKAMTPEDVHTGRFPQEVLDTEIERVEALIEGSEELKYFLKQLKNAHGLYVRTRGEASRRSIKRAKELGNLPQIHPLLAHENPEMKKTADFKAALRNFRPNLTVFEVESMKKGKVADESGLAMLKKRVSHQGIIVKEKANKQKQSMEATSEKAKKEAEKQRLQAKKDNTGDDDSEDEEDEKFIAKLKTHAAKKVKEDETGTQVTVPKRKLSKAERKRLKKGILPPPPTSSYSKMNADDTPEEEANNMKKEKKSFKDPNFYIDSLPQNYDAQADLHLSIHEKTNEGEKDFSHKARLEEALLDVNPDDSETIMQKQRTYRWDKRKKAYVMSSLADHIKTKRVRNEAGAMVKVNDKDRGKLYEKWQKTAKKRLGAQGGLEDGEDDMDEGDYDDDNGFPSAKRQRISEKNKTNVKIHSLAMRNTNIANAHAKEELKSENLIRHERKVKQKRKEKNARTPKKFRKQDDGKKKDFRTPKKGKGEASTDRFARSRAIVKSNNNNNKRGTKRRR